MLRPTKLLFLPTVELILRLLVDQAFERERLPRPAVAAAVLRHVF